ncbi:MAG: beta-galactosidase [Planctomycetota bacterium]|jgi:beta-galactosidase
MSERVLLGVAYYPECWPKSEWKLDVRRMAEAGIDRVRLAEFAWSHMEPAEGVFDLDWLEEFVDLAGSHGIKTIMCTPTEAPPPWLTAAYPDTLPVGRNGLRRGAGSRRHCCINSHDYVRCSDRITEALAKRFGRNPNVVAWQLDNEAACHDALVCFCAECERAFREWLKGKYKTPEALNDAWFGAFWSAEVRDFRHIHLNANPVYGVSPQYELDARRFGGESWVRFLDRQIAILRPLTGSQKITHNITWYQEQINAYKLTARQDVLGYDNYSRRPWEISIADAWMGAVKKDRKFWVMEMTPGRAGGWGTRPRPLALARHRQWFVKHYLRGAGLCSMWHWRRHLGGQEMFNSAVIEHDGSLAEGFTSVSQVGRFIREHGELLVKNTPRRDAAILHTYDDLMLGLIHGPRVGLAKHQFIAAMMPLFRELERRGVGVTFARPTDDLSAYKLVLAPQTFIMTDEVARRLEAYVRSGGVLVGSGPMGAFDEFGKAQPRAAPAFLTDVFGARLGPVSDARGRDGSEGERVKGAFSAGWGGGEFACGRAQSLVADAKEAAEVLATFASHDLEGAPAVTRKGFGEGKAIFVGISRPDEAALRAIAGGILADAALETCDPGPEDLEVIRGDLLTGYLNLSEKETLTVALPRGTTDLLTGETTKELRLEPCGAAVSRNPA